jgi:hypothetical protein
MLATQSTELMIGNSQEVEAFAKRIKSMMRGGEKLSAPDALALAQFATVTRLNPFIGECWYIPNSGPMVGIAGARRLDQERTADYGGYSFPVVAVCSPEEAGATEAEVKDVVAAFRTEIVDTGAVAEYQKLFVATIQAMRDAGVSDPFAAAKEICGPRPSWVGYGFSKKSDQSRMNKTQLARKRSEADALKKKIVVPFGAQVAETDVAPDYVDVKAEEVTEKRSKEQNIAELGFTDAEKHEEIGLGDLDAVLETPPVQMYKFNDDRILKPVMKILSFSVQEAAATMHEAHKQGKVGTNLTIQEAEDFARALISPK